MIEDSTEGTLDQVFVVETDRGVTKEERTESGRDRFLLLRVPVAYLGVVVVVVVVWKEDCRRSAPTDGVCGGRKTFECRPGRESAFGTYNGAREGDIESREGERVETAISWGNSMACLQAAARGVGRAGGGSASHENGSAKEEGVDCVEVLRTTCSETLPSVLCGEKRRCVHQRGARALPL
jgi:hypothetical protein